MSPIKIYYARMEKIKSLPDRIGTYIITHTYDNIHAKKYVGATANLHNRICGHNDKNIIHVEIYVTDSIHLARLLEKILIYLIRPVTNSTITSLSYKNEKLMNKLLIEHKIKEYTLNNISKIGSRYLKVIKKKNDTFNNSYGGNYIVSKTLKTHKSCLKIAEENNIKHDSITSFMEKFI